MTKTQFLYVTIKIDSNLNQDRIQFLILCYMQTKNEGKLFGRFKFNSKFGKLISAIIQKSWPKDSQGRYHQDEEVVLRHLLSWTAAKDIFQLHGIV